VLVPPRRRRVEEDQGLTRPGDSEAGRKSRQRGSGRSGQWRCGRDRSRDARYSRAPPAGRSCRQQGAGPYPAGAAEAIVRSCCLLESALPVASSFKKALAVMKVDHASIASDRKPPTPVGRTSRARSG